MRPISKKDLHDVFSHYKMQVAEDEDEPIYSSEKLKREMKPTYKRLYEDASKGKRGEKKTG